MQNDKNIAKNKYLSSVSDLTSEGNQKFIGIILTLCALSFFGFFAIKPAVSTIFKLQKEISDNELILEKQETKIKNLTKLRVQYSNLQSDLPVVMSAITAGPDVTLLFGQIQSIGEMSNITLKELQNFEVEIIKNDKSVEKDYYSYSFSIAGTGSSENIYKFIQTLANMERVVNIDTFSISNIINQESRSLEFNVKGTTFFKSNL